MAVNSPVSKAQSRRSKKMEGRRRARRNAMVSERNKVKRINRHLARFPWDQGAIDALERLKKACLGVFEVKVPDRAESPVQYRAKTGTTPAKLRNKKYGLGA